jgi:hypothetical protein
MEEYFDLWLKSGAANGLNKDTLANIREAFANAANPEEYKKIWDTVFEGTISPTFENNKKKLESELASLEDTLVNTYHIPQSEIEALKA